MQVLDGPLTLAITDDDPTSFVVRGPNWELAARGVPCIDIHVYNDSAPIIKREVGFYMTLHITSVNDIATVENIVAAHNDSVLDQVVSTVPTPAIESTATPAPVPANLILLFEQHKELVLDWLRQHREVRAWVAPPRKLVVDLRAHLLATASNSPDRQNIELLSPTILARLADHGHISRGRKAWMRRLLRHAGDVGTREIMPDGEELYTILVRTHLGHNGRAHIVPSSMRKKLSQAYVFAPGEDFYRAWVSACHGCTWSD